jgi:hypothetical protein
MERESRGAMKNRNPRTMTTSLATMLLLSTLALHAQQVAFFQTNSKGADLNHFVPTKVVAIEALPPGRYVVDAKATMENADSDSQNGSCTLVVKSLNFNQPAVVLDSTAVRINGTGCQFSVLPPCIHAVDLPAQSIALQGTFCSNSTAGLFSIEVDCGTYNGGASESAITALRMPTINVTGGNSAPPPGSSFGSCVQQQVQ